MLEQLREADAYAEGRLPLSEVRCVLCGKAPCECPEFGTPEFIAARPRARAVVVVTTATRPRKRRTPPPGLAPFRAATSPGPLWATAPHHPSIWMRWMCAHEELVESEQAMTFGNRHIGVDVIGRLVTGPRLGEWMIVNWRPRCGTCGGTGQVELHAEDGPGGRQAVVDLFLETGDAGLRYMPVALVQCADCRQHPGWVVG